MPVVAGPALFFIAIEQGDRFAAEAAGATLVALIGVAAFGLTYAWTCPVAPWPIGLAAGWLVFIATTLGLNTVSWPPVFALAAALASFVAAGRLLPVVRPLCGR